MKLVPALLLTGVGLFAIAKAATLNTVQALNLTLADFEIDLSGIKVGVIAENRTSNDVTINKLTGDIFLNDHLAGEIGPFAPMPIPGNSNVLLPVTIDINPAVILIQAISIFNGSAGVAAVLKMVGVLTADAIDIPFTVTRKLL
jgi:hypothetical protein